MTLSSLSLQQLQAYRRRPADERAPEVLCTAFSLPAPVSVDILRQAARDTLEQACIPLPDTASACVVEAMHAPTLANACERAAAGLLASGDACALALASTGDGVWLVAVSVSWLFDADGLARFAIRALERAAGVVLADTGDEASYADYVHWQHEVAASPEAQFGRQYWTRGVSTFRPLDDLQIEERLETTEPVIAAFGKLSLSDDVAERLRATSARLRVPADAMVLAAWLVVLESLRPEQRKDLVVAVADRDDDLFGDLTGRLVLELPLSFPIAGHAPFASLVKRVGDQLEEADEWKECFSEQHLPIDAERSAMRFSARTLLAGEAGGANWQEHACAPFNPSSRLELIFLRAPRPTLVLCGDPGRYADTTLEFLLGQLESVLTQALGNALASVDALIAPDAFDCASSAPVATGVAADAAPELAGACIDAALERHASRIAIRHGERTLTYEALARRIDAQAHAFDRSGIGVEDTVGLAVADPIAYIVAALAAWRVGAHFIALASDVPPARIKQIVERAGACALVDAQGATRMRDGAAARTRNPADRATESECGSPFEHLHDVRRVHPEALAYVIFTSGTSGEPRAVAVAHRALANQLAALAQRMPLEPGAIALVRTPATFDASLWEWLHPLCGGATLHVLDAADAFLEQAIVETLNRQPVAVAQMTPSLLRRCLRVGGADALAKPTHLVIGGEPFDADLVAPVTRRGGALVNAYGPAETCINASLHRVTRDRYRRTVPIGEPLGGYAFHIVDTALRPVPVGRIGMLCIGGAGLARCLVGAAAATAAAFLPDPFAVDAGARMYATGDLVRRLPNGDIEFVGRADDQLKLNGVRIDGAEIVAAIKAERGVKDAALVLLDEPLAGLVACIVPESANHFSAEALNLALRARLPAPMCPAKFVALDALPIDAHGKVDRRALRAFAAAECGVTHVAPRTPTEQRVAACWRAVLNVERVGVHDNFFLNGGHSLSFGRLIIALRDAFGIDLPLSSVIGAPSVAALAAHIDAKRAAENGNVRAR
ncbi:amino acid adenylation domain-containing protein [Burkholderia ubonensis]|uniref:non-ribosomal peptide synthetase n=1 Tax=Burkholderia ubonensis TaxID=101571 RepID=UPI0009B3B37C|nr:amino acid adenylation domain-containing protein [Burkholderia ubonensis]